MRIVIVDDEDLARLRLQRLLADIEGCEVVAEAANGQQALDCIEQVQPDLVMLDVRMPGLDGMSVAERLAEYDEPPAVVFCTAYDEYALEAFNTLAQGYIVKPVQKQQLEQVIAKSRRLTRPQSAQLQDGQGEIRRHISAKTRKGMELIPIDSIYCFIADQKYVTVVHREGETLIDETLKELESEFSRLFARVHRNALVAQDKIEAMEKERSGQYCLKLSGTEFKPMVSRRHLPGVRALLERL
ncbi:LytR/AlgR family response regulator transcription factor [Agaribacterium haliotis]|uniref:LytR/AlgR family response regulator transcription factor n=1 Tax=Agaribacterium haliotis TaxID=2013869 RepID=UPI000BB52C6E|nr:LytTR family DNA-binding domain-containing protein [Agaribacterium haliotis]